MSSELWDRIGEEVFLNPYFYLVFIAVVLAESFIPAIQGQKILSNGFLVDFCWVFINLTFKVLVFTLLYKFLRGFYDQYLSFLSIHLFDHYSKGFKVCFALLLGDFVYWFGHYVRHKVKLFWYFHEVHHSQKQLNFFSEYRVHPIDDLFIYFIHFIPLLMFIESFTTILAIQWLRHWHSRIYYSNIKSNFGPLKYILVTPQSHRIHHSADPIHQDKNFGLTFSIWDHIFGTQYKGYTEYPITGSYDSSFPTEHEVKNQFLALLKQMTYPFQKLYKRVGDVFIRGRKF